MSYVRDEVNLLRKERRSMMMAELGYSGEKSVKSEITERIKMFVRSGIESNDDIHTIMSECVCETKFILSKYLGHEHGVRPIIVIDQSMLTFGSKDSLSRYVALRMCEENS